MLEGLKIFDFGPDPEACFTFTEPKDIPALAKSKICSINRDSFELLSRGIWVVATGVLSSAGLPSNPRNVYLVTEGDDWRLVEDGRLFREKLRPYLVPLDVAVGFCGYARDSLQGCAAEILMTLEEAKDCLDERHLDEAMALAFHAGELTMHMGMKEVFEKDYVAGERVREGGRKAHVLTYGTPEEREAKHAAYREAFEAAVAGGLGRMDAYGAVARQFGIQIITVRRAVSRSR